jgi:ribosomal-protein-alanine N-acetyltransferase
VFALPFFRRDLPALKGNLVTLRVPFTNDYREWSAVRGESRAFLEPWEPRWTPDELDRTAWRLRISRYRERSSGKLAGGITLGNIRHGVSQSGHVGYWIGERFGGRGLMTDAVKVVARFAFDTLRLHRIEAACIPDNIRSIRVLEKAGFRREGLLRSYLRINGIWQDHYLYARIADDPLGGAGTKD